MWQVDRLRRLQRRPQTQGGAWNPDGTILFNASGNSALSRVSATGGTVSPVTALEQGEVRHVLPRLLPDGQHFLYGTFPDSSIYVGSLNATERTQLLRDVGTRTVHSQNRLFFTRADTLMTQAFDAAALELIGEPSAVAEIPAGRLQRLRQRRPCLPVRDGRQSSRLAWFDRTGKSLGALGEAANYYTMEISPDGSHAAGGIREQVNTACWGRLAVRPDG